MSLVYSGRDTLRLTPDDACTFGLDFDFDSSPEADDALSFAESSGELSEWSDSLSGGISAFFLAFSSAIALDAPDKRSDHLPPLPAVRSRRKRALAGFCRTLVPAADAAEAGA